MMDVRGAQALKERIEREQRRKREQDTDECPDCGMTWEFTVAACPHCGLTIETVSERLAQERRTH